MRNSCGCPAVSAQKNRFWWGDSGRTLAWGRPPDAAGGLFPVSETRGEARYAEFHGVGAAVRAPPCKQDAHRCAGWAWGEAGLARCAACRGPRGGELGAALQVVVQRYARLPELRRVRQVIAQALDHAVVYQVDLRGDHGVAPFESDQVGADQRGRVNVQLRFAMRESSGLAARVSGWVWRGLVWGSGFGASAGSTAVFIRYSWAAAVDALAERFRDGAEPGTTRVRSREVNSAGRHGFRVPVLRCSPPPLSFDETPLPRLCAGVLVER